MNTVNFSNLHSSPSVILDITSLETFLRVNSRGDFLLGTRDEFIAALGWTSRFGKSDHSAIIRAVARVCFDHLQLLELIVVHESLVVDSTAFTEYRLNDDRRINFLLDQPTFARCVMPKIIAETALSKLSESSTGLAKMSAALSKVRYTVNYKDYINRNSSIISRFIGNMRSSARPQSPPPGHGGAELEAYQLFRALYYLTISETCGKPLVVSAYKQKAIIELKETCEARLRGIHRHFSDTASGLNCEERSTFSAPMPPIQEMIVRNWLQTGTSAWEAAMDVRGSKEASAYRSMILELTNDEIGGVSAHGRAKHEIAKIDDLLRSWAKRGGASGSRRRWRNLNLQKAPAVGWIAAAFGLFENVSVPDLSLTATKPAEVFMSEWFNQELDH